MEFRIRACMWGKLLWLHLGTSFSVLHRFGQAIFVNGSSILVWATFCYYHSWPKNWALFKSGQNCNENNHLDLKTYCRNHPAKTYLSYSGLILLIVNLRGQSLFNSLEMFDRCIWVIFFIVPIKLANDV